MKKFYLLLLVFCTSLSCQRTIEIVWIDNGHTPIDRTLYNEDKNQFIHSYFAQIRSKEWLMEDYPEFSIDDRFFVLVDTILYSNNRNYMFIFYGRGDKCAISDNTDYWERPSHYCCESVIGYRDTIRETLRFFENMLTVSGDDFRVVMNDVEYYYLNSYKNDRVIPLTDRYGTIGYNVNDSLFFEKSPLFKKYNDTLYYFQINHVVERKHLNKPDSIILKKEF